MNGDPRLDRLFKQQVARNGRPTAPSAASIDTNEDEGEPDWAPAYPRPVMDSAALYGLAGDIVLALADETEADIAAMYLTVLTYVGNMLGGEARAYVGDDEHPGRLFTAIVGETSTGAKGTSAAAIRPIVRAASQDWFEHRIFHGFSSGEAIVSEWADDAIDRRGMVLEPEFARILTVAGREGSTLSPIFRQAWDGTTLSVRRAKDRMIARGVHMSVLAHITPSELRAKLSDTDTLNGFANRFLYVYSKRSKKLPSGGYVEPGVIGGLAKRLASVISPIQRVYRRTFSAEDLWAKLYLAEPDRDGIVGALTARSAAQRLRLAVIFAALDGALQIRPEHILAADACWRYAVASVEHIFGDLRADRKQDRLLRALRAAHPGGLTGTEQAAALGNTVEPGELDTIRREFEAKGLARTTTTKPTSRAGGRPTLRTYAIARSRGPNQPNQRDQPAVDIVNSVDSGIERDDD